MRLRLLVFAPPAVLVTAVILVAASSFVSALETSFTPNTMNAVKIQRYESDCDVLYWAIHEISRSATNCDAESATCGSAFEWSKSDASDRTIQPDTFVF